MTLYWKIAELVHRRLPKDWLRSWAVDYANGINAALVDKGGSSHFTLVPHQPMSVKLDNDSDPVNLMTQDLLSVEISNKSKRLTINVQERSVH